jgi:hypothetical protein
MRYNLTEPCDQCPFLIGSGFTFDSLVEYAAGEFPCHKTCSIDDETGSFVPCSEKTPHCAGALIFLEKQNRPHQMMRICERLGFYDASKLNMAANVGSVEEDYPIHRRRRRRKK